MARAARRPPAALLLLLAAAAAAACPAAATTTSGAASSGEAEASPAAPAAAAARRGALGTDDACGAAAAAGAASGGGGGGLAAATCAVSALQRQSSKQGAGEEASGLEPGAAPPSPLQGCQGIDCVARYVAMDDGEFAWRDTGARVEGVDEETSMPWKGYVLNVTSQRWLSEAEIDHPIWWHTVIVVVPEQLEFPDWVTLNIAFGYYPDYPEGTEFLTPLARIDNRYGHSHIQDAMGPSIEVNEDNLLSKLPELQNAASQIAAYTAVRTKALAAVVLQLPNGYQTFTDDFLKLRRAGDLLKGFAYTNFLTHPNRPELIDDLPVAKGVVKAMDAIAAFVPELLPGAKQVERFGLVGYSKLGLATLITAAIDERVAAIAPTAIYLDWRDSLGQPVRGASLAQLGRGIPFGPLLDPLLNSLDNETLALDAWRLLFGPMDLLKGTPPWNMITSITDAVHWMDKLTMPKLYILGSNDAILGYRIAEYGTRHLREFRGQTSYLEVPNKLHDETLIAARASVAAFFRGVLLNKSPPTLDWQLEEASGRITAKVGSGAPPVIRARRWAGQTDGFEPWGFVNATFQEQALQETSLGSRMYQTTLEPAPEGDDPRGGTYVQFDFEWPEPGFNFTISTPMWVSPLPPL